MVRSGQGFLYIIVLSLVSFGHLVAHGPLEYAQIGEKLISSFGILPDGQNSARPTIDKHGIPRLNAQEQRKFIFPILAKAETLSADAQDVRTQVLRNLVDDLELFYAKGASNNHRHLFSKISHHTVSLFGEAVFAQMLTNLVTDTNLLRKRQAFIKELVDNSELFNKIQTLVEHMHTMEPGLLSFWVGEESEIEATINSFYFQGVFSSKKWNKDPRKLAALVGWRYMWTVEPVVRDILQATGAMYASNRVMASIMGEKNAAQAGLDTSLYGAFTTSVLGILPIKEIYNYRNLGTSVTLEQYLTDERTFLTVPQWEGIFRQQNLPADNQEKINAIKWAKLCCLNTISNKIYFLYKRIESMGATANYIAHLCTIFAQMQTKLIHMASFVDDIKQLDELMNRYPQMSDGLIGSGALHEIAHGLMPGSVHCAELLELLSTPTFKGEASFFSYTGRILRAYDLMRKNKDCFAHMLQAYGELDACLAVAKLVKKFQQERVNICFVEYQEGDKPYLKLDNFWNLLIDPAVVVTNNIELGADHAHRNMIVTGSNTAGKSTLLKATTFAIQFAQTFGVAPATYACLTPFAVLGTSWNIVDNPAEKLSKYQAEVNRANLLCQAAADAHKEQKLCFLVMDELFTGTASATADMQTYTYGKTLAANPHTSYILATHFVEHPILLEQQTGGVCKNYKVEAFADTNGAIVRPFKLEVGISQNNIANDIVRRAAIA